MKMPLIISLLLFTASARTQPLPLSTPRDEGFSPERLERLHDRFAEMVRQGKKAGAITMIVRNGRIADWKAYGFRDVGRQLPMEKDTICRIWSMSKVITSVGVLMLIEEGKVALSDPVYKFIPELKALKVLTGGTADRPEIVDAVRPVTVKHLLTHTSGLTYNFEAQTVGQLYNRKRIFDNGSLKEFIQKVASLPLIAQPGEKYNYGISTDVLGYLVQVVSRMPFDRFVQTRILAPLRMDDTFFDVPPAKRGRVAKTYEIKDGKLSESPPDDMMGNLSAPVPYGGMGLYSTIGDYARFAQMLLNQGELDGVRLLGRKTVELMMANHLNNLAVPHTGGSGAYGFGLGGSVRIDLAEGNTLGSLGQFGWDGAATTSFRIDPKERSVALVFFQHVPFDKSAVELFSTLMYQAIVD